MLLKFVFLNFMSGTLSASLVYASAACNKGSQMLAVAGNGISIYGSNSLVIVLTPFVWNFSLLLGCHW